MEAIWMIPLYLIIPFVAIILIVVGRMKKSKTNMQIGLFLLALPFLHGLLIHFSNNELKNKIAGNYAVNGSEPILKLNDDGTFYLKQSLNYTSYGKGKWDIEIIDLEYVILNFIDPKQGSLSFEINENKNVIELKDAFYNNNIIKLD